MMKLYLDMCCYNRPYDPQEQMRIHLETQAKLHIQKLIKSGEYELVSSYTLDYELSNVPLEERKQAIAQFIRENASEYIGAENRTAVEQKAETIMATGIKEKDAMHLASAILSKCDCFISTDKRLLKYQTSEILMCNPVDLVIRMEGAE